MSCLDPISWKYANYIKSQTTSFQVWRIKPQTNSIQILPSRVQAVRIWLNFESEDHLMRAESQGNQTDISRFLENKGPWGQEGATRSSMAFSVLIFLAIWARIGKEGKAHIRWLDHWNESALIFLALHFCWGSEKKNGSMKFPISKRWFEGPGHLIHILSGDRGCWLNQMVWVLFVHKWLKLDVISARYQLHAASVLRSAQSLSHQFANAAAVCLALWIWTEWEHEMGTRCLTAFPITLNSIQPIYIYPPLSGWPFLPDKQGSICGFHSLSEKHPWFFSPLIFLLMVLLWKGFCSRPPLLEMEKPAGKIVTCLCKDSCWRSLTDSGPA